MSLFDIIRGRLEQKDKDHAIVKFKYNQSEDLKSSFRSVLY